MKQHTRMINFTKIQHLDLANSGHKPTQEHRKMVIHIEPNIGYPPEITWQCNIFTYLLSVNHLQIGHLHSYV